jgi:hypothetical protein
VQAHEHGIAERISSKFWNGEFERRDQQQQELLRSERRAIKWITELEKRDFISASIQP